MNPWRAVLVAAGLVASPLLIETRIAKSRQPPDDSWRRVPVKRRGRTLLGVSFRPLQTEAFGLDPRKTLDDLLQLPFDMIRLPAYWDRIESGAGDFDTSELDWQLDACERAGKQVVVSVGAVKNFGYPELFVPDQYQDPPLAPRSLVAPSSHPCLLEAAKRFIGHIVGRFRDRNAVVAWQLEHEGVDPRGVESSWRLSTEFVRGELTALRDLDPDRPVVMNGFLPTSSVVRVSQGWQTRDQGDSLAVAARLADIVGIDYYPRHALFALGSRAVYMTGGRLPWQRALARHFVADVWARGKRVMVSEGQAEPWEAVTVPPSPGAGAMFTCGPADVILNYNEAMSWSRAGNQLYAYLFWGAEYWLLRDQAGDSSYMDAVKRVLDEA